MHCKINLYGMAAAASLLHILTSGCASSEAPLPQPSKTSYMQSAVGTPDELSPLAPPEARNVRKVGNQWLCDQNGRTMIYNEAAARWEPQQK
jgi:hypothetical protein